MTFQATDPIQPLAPYTLTDYQVVKKVSAFVGNFACLQPGKQWWINHSRLI